ncbi:restriction endonuclease [Brachyspira catarrhinii]|uniref:Restriction endonuclease n=1 Tax=Brachyspira catarrhinii TaxID=2528966 RepID=A0ABY2TRR5_9SPIR|nr:restriction endonuclease [Brachyspira catarrhinii]TKZ35585.1 restriction endonuclease [Brachyspira catarrhinii]
MINYDIYIYSVAVICFLLVVLLSIKILFRDKNKIKVKKDMLKKISELKKGLSDDSEDYDSMYQLAYLEDKTGDYESALDIYDKLAYTGYLDNLAYAEALQICKRLEDKYDKLDEKEKSFAYLTKIIKLEPNNIFYIIKIGTILGENGYNLIASNYFNKALLSKNEFEVDSLKVAAFSFFSVKDYGKSIKFLDEFYKRVLKYSNRNSMEVHNIEKSLISMYIILDELNIAKSFIESVLIEKNIDEDFKFYINKMYLFILYKLGDNERFKKVYDNLHELYLKNSNVDYADLILDYSFYSYFLREIEFSIKYFEIIKSFNNPKFEIYDIDTILKYLNQIIRANYQLTLLRDLKNSDENKYINDNYEKYIDKVNIETWETSINIWENSFVDLSYMSNLIQVEKTINIDGKILEDLKNVVDSAEHPSDKILTKKVDKIYDLDINEFRKLCKNIITSKLSYVIAQEYEDKFNNNINGDEINFLAYNIKGSKKDLTLISFKRWKKSSIGELMIRDFYMMVNEVDAKNGILIVPTELSNSAKSYVSHNDRITVYSRDQFNNLLKDEKL